MKKDFDKWNNYKKQPPLTERLFWCHYPPYLLLPNFVNRFSTWELGLDKSRFLRRFVKLSTITLGNPSRGFSSAKRHDLYEKTPTNSLTKFMIIRKSGSVETRIIL